MDANIVESRVLFAIVMIAAVCLWLVPSEDVLHLIQGDHFSVTVNPSFTNYTQYQSIHIQNTKSEEVKHVTIRFSAFGPLEKVSSSCIDGKFISTQYSYDIIALFEKIDPNYQCDVLFKTDPNTMMSDVSITADNLPKYEWTTISEIDNFFHRGIIVVLAGGTIVIGLLIYNQRRNFDYHIKLPSIPSNLEKSFQEKYGFESTGDDMRIIEAINQGYTASDDISDFTSIPKNEVKDKLKLMEKKGLFKMEKW